LGKEYLESDVIDEHPFNWLKKVRLEINHKIVLAGWQEIFEEEYRMYDSDRMESNPILPRETTADLNRLEELGPSDQKGLESWNLLEDLGSEQRVWVSKEYDRQSGYMREARCYLIKLRKLIFKMTFTPRIFSLNEIIGPGHRVVWWLAKLGAGSQGQAWIPADPLCAMTASENEIGHIGLWQFLNHAGQEEINYWVIICADRDSNPSLGVGNA
jgi:hypothetical protein